MSRIKWLIIVWLSLSNMSYSQDAPKDYQAEKMFELCNGASSGEDKRMQSLICTFRLQGVINIMIENCRSKSEGYTPSSIFTSKGPPSNKAARQAFQNYMETNPDKWGISWHIVVALAISEVFPCT